MYLGMVVEEAERQKSSIATHSIRTRALLSAIPGGGSGQGKSEPPDSD